MPGIQPVSAQPLLQVLGSPVTLVAFALVAFGGGAWVARKRLARLVGWLRPLRRAAASEFGIAYIERVIVRATWTAARALSRTQTGSLNWNMAAMLCGVLIVVGGLGLRGLYS